MPIDNGTKASSVRERIVDAKDFGTTANYILISGSTTVASTDGPNDKTIEYKQYIAKDIITAINDAEGTVDRAQTASYAQNAGTATYAIQASSASYSNQANQTEKIEVFEGINSDFYTIEIVSTPPSSSATPNIIYMVVEE